MTDKDAMRERLVALALACVLAIAGCASVESPRRPNAVPEILPGLLQGYLAGNELPNSLRLLPPPPAAGSSAFARDREASRESLAQRGTPRWEQAVKDADLRFPAAAGSFAAALGFQVTEQDTPHLYILLRRTLTDAGLATYAAKNHYDRARPFTFNKEPTCTPEEEKLLRTDGSYPSGHTSVGWAWALILTEVVPERTDAILVRGLEFGESRVVCNVHWQSDVDAGRLIGAAAVARLHADAAFRADLDQAKAEVKRVAARR